MHGALSRFNEILYKTPNDRLIEDPGGHEPYLLRLLREDTVASKLGSYVLVVGMGLITHDLTSRTMLEGMAIPTIIQMMVQHRAKNP